MTNRYAPPKAPVGNVLERPVYTEQYKREKSAIRPLGVVVVVAWFGLFSALGVAFLAIERDWWLVGYAVLTALLVYWLRRLWWGDNGVRKTAVFVGFLVGVITYLGSPEEPIQTWSASELASLVEGCYFFLAACYLIYARKSPFFAGR